MYYSATGGIDGQRSWLHLLALLPRGVGEVKMLKIYGDILSGNCYKIKLLCSLLDIEHEWIHIDILRQETHTQAFLELNPNGKVPTVVLGSGESLWESNAIVNYLAHGSELVPDDPFKQAKVLQWQFFEQYSHEPYIAVARYIAQYLKLPEARKAEYHSKQTGGHKALAVMEQQLQETDFLVSEQYTVADISLYAYTHVASEGGFDLTLYPGISAWLARIAAHPRHTTIAAHLGSRSNT